MEIVYSITGVPIRLTNERWEHIVYDDEMDVLYVHFEEKPSSTHSEMTDEGIILDYQGERLVGLTILDASQREAFMTV